MLVEFSVKNFLSFKEKQTFSMQTAPYLKRFKTSNTFMSKPVNLLKNAVIIGPNGSGKTNLFSAIRLLRNMLINYSFDTKRSVGFLPYQPFKMDNNKDLIELEIVLLIDDQLFKYVVSFNQERIHLEYLESLNQGKNTVHFRRKYSEKNSNYIYYFADYISDVREKTRKNALYLSMLSITNDHLALKIIDWFKNKLVFIETDFRFAVYSEILEALYDDEFKRKVLQLLKVADFNIVDIEIKQKKRQIPSFIKEILEDDTSEDYFIINDIYTHYNSIQSNSTVPVHADSFESRGTKKMIIISTILLNAMHKGKTVLIDEFDSAFHLNITKFLLKIFNSENLNKKSQFILNTHELSLLDNNVLRVDQIWFTEKDKDNATDIYSLYDFNESYNRPRGDVSFATDYLKGKFGAVPITNEILLEGMVEL